MYISNCNFEIEVSISAFIKKSILLVLPCKNFNETEFITVKSGLQKHGYNIFIAADTPATCIGDNGLRVKSDISFFNMNDRNFSAIVLTGGMGVSEYYNNAKLIETVKNFQKAGKPIAAICGAPMVLANAGVLRDKQAVCYPELRKQFEKMKVTYDDNSIVLDDNILTGKDPYSASEFTDALLHILSE